MSTKDLVILGNGEVSKDCTAQTDAITKSVTKHAGDFFATIGKYSKVEGHIEIENGHDRPNKILIKFSSVPNLPYTNDEVK